MQRILLKTGYDFSHSFTAKVDGVRENVSDGTIKASLKNASKTIELIADTTQTNTGSAAWATGDIVIRFTAAQTAALVALINPEVATEAWLEVALTLAGLILPYPDTPILIEVGYTLS